MGETVLFETGEVEKTPKEIFTHSLVNADEVKECIIVTINHDGHMDYSFTPMDLFRFLGILEEAKMHGRMFWAQEE